MAPLYLAPPPDNLPVLWQAAKKIKADKTGHIHHAGSKSISDSAIKLKLLKDPLQAEAVSWQLKDQLDKGRWQPSKEEIEFLWTYGAFMSSTTWQTQLHWLQMMHRHAFITALKDAQIARLLAPLSVLSQSEKNFVKVWAVNLMLSIALAKPDYTSAFYPFLRAACTQPTKSLQARLRQFFKNPDDRKIALAVALDIEI